MLRIEILSGSTVINTIIASEAEAERLYPGAWRLADVQLPPPEPQTPQACSPAQGLRALYDLRGITEQHLLTMIASIPGDDQAAVDLRYRATVGLTRASEWRRDSETMQAMTQMLGLTGADLDALYAYAVEVQV